MRNLSSSSLPLQIVVWLAALTGCCRVTPTTQYCIPEPCHPREMAREERLCLNLPEGFSCSPFAPLTAEELSQDWGKELRMGLCFAHDFDLYRAITAFKRALFLLPEGGMRKREIEYDIALAYYLGKKYVEAVWAVEGCELVSVDSTFPAFHDLLLLLYDSRKHLGEELQAEHLLHLITQFEACEGEKLMRLTALEQGELPPDMAEAYCRERKSVRKAQVLNAVLPGAGYWYVGQKQTAITALLINALFLTAATEFFLHDNIAGGLITLTLESGWYFGGIYGGGLAAKFYNERLYMTFAERVTHREKLFPLMMLNYTF